MTNISPKDRLDAIDVLRLPDTDAVRWLKEKSCYEKSSFSSNPDQKLHRIASFAFSRRGSKQLRLAVARYGSHIRTLRNLFNKGTRSERLAVLSNPYIGPQNGGLFSSDLVLSKAAAEVVLQNYHSNTREFAVFANNPQINREWLADEISSWLEIKGFDSNGLLFLVHYLVDNPVINARRDVTLMDGWAEHSYNQLNLALVNLLQTAPVTRDWADVLSRMLANLYLPFVPNFKVDLIERWNDPEPTENGERFCFPYLREQITRYLIVRNHRSEIKNKYSLDHDDFAVRKGFYSSLQPYELFKGFSQSRDFHYPAFRYPDGTELSESQQQFVDFCKKCFDRDKNDFVESLIWNENFWKKKEDRAFLNDIAWSLADDPHSSMHVPNLYNAKEQYHHEHNPSFFSDDELADVSYENTVEGKLSNLQNELNKLHDGIQSLSLEEFVDEQRGHFESMIGDAQSQIRYLSKNVNEKSEELTRMIAQGPIAQQLNALESRIRYQGGLIWLLVIVIAVIGFLNIN